SCQRRKLNIENINRVLKTTTRWTMYHEKQHNIPATATCMTSTKESNAVCTPIGPMVQLILFLIGDRTQYSVGTYPLEVVHAHWLDNYASIYIQTIHFKVENRSHIPKISGVGLCCASSFISPVPVRVLDFFSQQDKHEYAAKYLKEK
ncbi:hypothetical protein ACJX0J_028956, partial [Zea mays]